MINKLFYNKIPTELVNLANKPFEDIKPFIGN